jgi:hypothetical protein
VKRNQTDPPANLPEQTRWIESVADLLDTRFRIPFTNIRFGLDFLLGLIPYVGDMVSLFISVVLVGAIFRHGVSGSVALRMIGNVILDALVGTIPLLGDVFDLTFRANRRNLELLRAHYQEGRYRGSAWPFIIGVVFLFLGLVVGSWWLLIFWIEKAFG